MARCSKSALVAEVLRDPITRQYMIKRVGMIVKRELSLMCSEKTGSILSSKDVCDLKEFTWDKLCDRNSFQSTSISLHTRDLYSDS